MKHRYLGFLGLALLLLLTAGQAFAGQSDARVARLRYIEGDVTLYPYDGQRPSDATINSPLLEGDEIETKNGRAEISFRNGIVVRIADYTAVKIDSSYSPMILDLLQGTVFVDSHLVDRFGEELEIQAGDAQVFLINEGNIRVDLGSEGSVRVTATDGEAEVRASGSRVLLESGERTYIDAGSAPERPQAFNRDYDELDDWNQSRNDLYARNDYGRSGRYVDESIYYDTYELDNYGDWRPYEDYGNVWVPRVSYGWRPYYDGRWNYYNDNWFWVSHEPWGWAPYHYGRWGWAINFGWYWIPGTYFAPSWVSWYNYGDYIGWCPLGYYNNPVYYYDHRNNLPSIQKQKTALNAANSWTFVRKEAIGDRSIKTITATPSEIKDIRIEKDKVVGRPDKQLVSHVLPKSIKTAPAYVNDKRVVSEKGPDLDNPVGLKHVDEDIRSRKSTSPFDGGQKSGSPSSQPIQKGGDQKVVRQAPEQNWERNRPAPQPSNKHAAPKPGGSSPVKKPTPQNYDRDDQFERDVLDRAREAEKLYRSGTSPSYRDSNEKSGRENSQSGNQENLPWYKDPRSYDRDDQFNRDDDSANPRYMEGAKKVFERFDTDPRSSDSETRDYDTSDRSEKSYRYEAPPQDNRQSSTTRSESSYSGSKSSGSSSGSSGSSSYKSGGSSQKSSSGSSKSSTPRSSSKSSSSSSKSIKKH